MKYTDMTPEQKQRYNEYNKQWRTTNKFKIKKANHDWYSNNRQRVLAQTTEYQREHKQRIRVNYEANKLANPIKELIRGAKSRAKKKGIPFNITQDDLFVPTHCPVLGIPLITTFGESTDNTPSIDRIIPALGYVKGNVIIVSKLANRIKTNATPDQIQAVATFYKNLEAEE